MRLLLVEDDRSLAKGIETALKQEGYVVDWMEQGRSAIHCVETEPYDTIILDLGLPDLDGIDVLSRIRKTGHDVPVLILTARDGLEHRVGGLDAGADDYLVKPFDTEELLARVRVLIRRQSGRAITRIDYGDLVLYPEAQRVEFNSEPVALPRREFMLLHELLSHQGRVLTRDQLEQAIYDFAEDVGSNAIEVHIHHLRKKFGNDLIRTVRGVGYSVEKRKQSS